MNHVDVVVIGGGAAGLMCAIEAGKRGRSVIVLERSNKIGKKILMSGGGRCNFTNLYTNPSHFISANPHFCKSALSRYTQQDFVALIEKHDIAYHEKALGQLFCDNSSKDVVTMLLKECGEASVEILTRCGEVSVSPGDRFAVMCSRDRFSCESLVIASGGLSIPKMGASDLGYRVARQFGLRVTRTRAGLVPFMFTGAMHELCQRLSGVSCNVSISCDGTVFDEDMLFTHRGLSGPAVLQTSSYWSPGEAIVIDLLPNGDTTEFLLHAKAKQPKSSLRNVLAEELPNALAAELQTLFWPAMSNRSLAETGDDQLRQIANQLSSWSIKPAATEGYRTAEVTLGGIDTNELSSKKMECRRVPGLYFVGEVVDVSGHLGGFNFQWAWASGHAAGQFA